MPGITIHGYAYNRVFTYTENGIHHEIQAPGGAALLNNLLNGESAALDDTFKREYAELQQLNDKKSGSSYYSIAHRMGISEGCTALAVSASKDCAAIFNSYGSEIPLPDCPVLWAADSSLPDREYFGRIAANCFLFINADVLRKAGALVSRQISWERSATELIWQLQNNPDISYLLKAPHVLIAFAQDGAVYLRRENEELRASLVLTHGSGERTLFDKLHGELDDAFVLMAASLAKQFTAVMRGEKPLQILPILKTAETLMTSGYTIDMLQNSEFTIITEADEAEASFEIPLKPGQSAIDPDNWCVSNNVGGKRIFDTAFEYVMEGPKAIANLPQLSFGALTTVDRWEIEAFQNIRNLIKGYASDNATKPLSIAVFGSPGSGKSFGVTQIAENVLPGKVKKLELNVSQFTSFNDLGAAFQKVRDVILTGKLPLVFFDEFDSDKDGTPLGWIKSFLMPMQDGKFKDDSGEHPLGKCILVFAGGTSASFEEFAKPMQSGDNSVQQAGTTLKVSDFKTLKVPDFISRLKGTINVLGPNPKDETDNNYILRRALLLRSLCERKLGIRIGGKAPVSPNIVWAMLLVPAYKHGARSMEAILDMSRLEGNVWEPVSLPFYSQLSLHVDADAFIKLVLRDVILNSYVEQLARAIHADFVRERIAEGDAGHINAVSWEALPDDIKESNRDVARSYSVELNKVGYAYDAGDTPFPSIEEFDDATALLLAQNQHMRYVNERTAAGWTYGKKRDNKKKTNPTLVDWDRLPPDEQKKDYDIVNNIIPLLKSIGLRVYKTI